METDVIIVGGGPAGLSAALLLGRCCRRVTLFDNNRPRNRASKAIHGYLSRDGVSPAEMRRVSFRQLRPYKSVVTRKGKIVAARLVPGGFEVEHEDGGRFQSRKLLLATGVRDVLPDLPGIDRFYGRSAFHCPFCDGWEQRDRPLAVCGKGDSAFSYALELFSWSRSITLCSTGPSGLGRRQLKQLRQLEIRVKDANVVKLSGRGPQLSQIHFDDGTRLPCEALFFCSEERPLSELAIQLNATTTSDGRVKRNRRERTSVPGLFVAGNTSRGVQLAIVAAAEGAKAACAINEEINQENIASFGRG